MGKIKALYWTRDLISEKGTRHPERKVNRCLGGGSQQSHSVGREEPRLLVRAVGTDGTLVHELMDFCTELLYSHVTRFANEF